MRSQRVSWLFFSVLGELLNGLIYLYHSEVVIHDSIQIVWLLLSRRKQSTYEHTELRTLCLWVHMFCQLHRSDSVTSEHTARWDYIGTTRESIRVNALRNHIITVANLHTYRRKDCVYTMLQFMKICLILISPY